MRSQILEIDAERQFGSIDGAATLAAMRSLLLEADALGDHFAAARASSAIGDVELDDGRMASGVAIAEIGLAHARAAQHRRETARQLHGLIIGLVAGPVRLQDVVGRCEEIVREQAIDPVFQAFGRCCLAEALARLGDVERARRELADATDVVERYGHAIPLGIVAQSAMVVEQVLDDAAAWERWARVAGEAYVSLGWTAMSGTMTAAVAESVWAQGRQADARALIDEARVQGDYHGRVANATFHRGFARVLASDGQTDPAEQHLARAEAALAASDALGELGELAFAGAQVGAATGRPEMAATRIAEAERLFGVKGDVSSLARVGRFRESAGLPEAAQA